MQWMPWKLITVNITLSCLPLYHRWTPKTWIPNMPTSRWPTWHLSLRRRRPRSAGPTLRCTTTSTALSSRRPSRCQGRSTAVWRSSARGAPSSPVRLLPAPSSPGPLLPAHLLPCCPAPSSAQVPDVHQPVVQHDNSSFHSVYWPPASLQTCWAS